MNSNNRPKLSQLILLLAVLPILPAAIVWTITVTNFDHRPSLWSLGLLPAFYIISAVATSVLAAPLFYVLGRLGLVNRWTTYISGALIGMLVVIVVTIPNLPGIGEIGLYSGIGLVTSIVFWAFYAHIQNSQTDQ